MVLISDLMDKGGYEPALRYLLAQQMDVYVIHVLSPEELDPDVKGDLKLVDCEDRDVAEITVSRPLLDRYKRTLAAFVDGARDFCTRRGMNYLMASTETPVDKLVAKLSARSEGWCVECRRTINIDAQSLSSPASARSSMAYSDAALGRSCRPGDHRALFSQAAPRSRWKCPAPISGAGRSRTCTSTRSGSGCGKSLLLLLQLLLDAADHPRAAAAGLAQGPSSSAIGSSS